MSFFLVKELVKRFSQVEFNLRVDLLHEFLNTWIVIYGKRKISLNTKEKKECKSRFAAYLP